MLEESWEGEVCPKALHEGSVKGKARIMRKHLQIALMLTATTAIATSFFLSASLVWAAEGDGPSPTITTTEEHGRKVYVNDDAPARTRPAQVAQPKRPSLVYWSSKENRWKPVPSAGTVSMQAARHNVDPNLVRAVVKVESNFNSNAVSRKGAMGLMQLMPQTARQLKVKNPFDPEQNVDAGVRHLKKLLESYGGDIRLSLAAYNAGSGAVARSTGIPRYPETRNYVRRITNLYFGGGDPGSYLIGNPVHDPVRVGRDARGVLYITNTE